MKRPSQRTLILSLLFLATALNAIDRQTLSVLGPTLRRELHLSESGYANVVTAFLISYTVMYSVSGRLVDFLGARRVLSLSLAWWSIASMFTGLARGAVSLGVFRCLLGVGEPCVYPAGVKACADWFPPRQRALATGIFSAGGSFGAVAAPPVVALLTMWLGWRFAFVLPGILGLCWLPFWTRTYRDRTRPLAAGRTRPSWRALLKQREVWALVLPRMLSDPVWYFYLFWLPDYLQRARHFTLGDMAAYGWLPFLFAGLGCISGGALSDWLVRRGVAPARARLRVLIAVGCIAPVGALVGVVSSIAAAMTLACLVVYLTQVWSTNTGTLAAELLPAEETGTAIGMMGTAGSLGGALFAQLLGILIARQGYTAAFLAAAALYPMALATLLALLRFRGAGPRLSKRAG
jgi:MFS transporter, ACS family, hexuronate transporter